MQGSDDISNVNQNSQYFVPKGSEDKRNPEDNSVSSLAKAKLNPLEVSQESTSQDIGPRTEESPPSRLIAKFDSSAPRIYPLGNKSKSEMREPYHGEVVKLHDFLQRETKNDHSTQQDLIYICMGAANVNEQVWPGFIFEALAQEKKVTTLLFEDGWKYPSMDRTAYREMEKALKIQDDDMNKLVTKNLDNFSVQQFLCGLPSPDQKVEEELKGKDKTLYESFLPSIYWKERKQVDVCVKLFEEYIEKLLKEGKQVVLGNHMGFLGTNSSILKLYNKLSKKYPNQLHYLWGWHGTNWMTKEVISKDDLVINKEKPPVIWTHYEGLRDCYLYL